MRIALRYTVRTDVGLIREGNEDSAYAGPHLLAIADGMGGHAAGEVASAVAIATLAPLDADNGDRDMLGALAEAISQANEALRQITITDPATEGMGTTVTAMLWSGDQVALCHIGDSRAYLLRGGELTQITHDHTLVQSLVDEGRLTPEAAATHPHRSLVVRALQSSVPAEPDLSMLSALPGDRYLLCSDGLSDVVSADTIRRTLAEIPDLDDAVAQLIDLAIRSGGPDNITCVLADVIDADAVGAVATDQVMTAGAVATEGDDGEAARSDSPATRAHLRSRSAGQAGGPGTESAGHSGVTGMHHIGHSAQDGDPAGNADSTVGTSGDDDGEEAVSGGAASGRRRWPIVTLSLIVMLAVVGVGGYIGWRLTQNEYFVGAVDGHVVVYRGVNQAVAGIRLSRVVEQTGIPLSAIPAAEAGQVQATINAETLSQARQIVSRIRRDYRCTLVEADIARWTASRPKPARTSKTTSNRTSSAKTSSRQPSTSSASTTAARSSGTAKGGTLKPKAPAPPPYPPRPVLPIYCAAVLGASG